MKGILNKLTKPSESYMAKPRVMFEKLSCDAGPSHLARAKVTGGWLVWAFQEGMSNGAGLTFMSDPSHEWTPETLLEMEASRK